MLFVLLFLFDRDVLYVFVGKLMEVDDVLVKLIVLIFVVVVNNIVVVVINVGKNFVLFIM